MENFKFLKLTFRGQPEVDESLVDLNYFLPFSDPLSKGQQIVLYIGSSFGYVLKKFSKLF